MEEGGINKPASANCANGGKFFATVAVTSENEAKRASRVENCGKATLILLTGNGTVTLLSSLKK